MVRPGMAREMNFDGLVGPTFNHGGFALGNLASARSSGATSNPREAAHQGLAKMRALHDLGVPQGVFPPHFRPELALARRLGFRGSDEALLSHLLDEEPRVLAACYSASAMWTANAATVSPSADSEDGRIHLTPANLQNQLHRSIEPRTTARILRAIFADEARFVVHPPLPASAALGDEGAANHTRFCPAYGEAGVQLFVFGASATAVADPKPALFPARQTKEACEALVRLHRLPRERTVLAQQNPAAIDAGVFHNDVIAVGDRDVLFFHEEAFLDREGTLAAIGAAFERVAGRPLRTLEVTADELDLDACVATYLFNSQLVATAEGVTLVCPTECRDHPRTRALLDAWVADAEAPLDAVRFFDVRQSMQGGGGPACLRLRVVLTDAELGALGGRIRFDEALHLALSAWVDRHYRDRLAPVDLADPKLLEASRVALDELTQLLALGSIYDFQR